MRPHERCWFALDIESVFGRTMAHGSRKFAKECVTTHRPKQLALKWMNAPALGPITGPLRQSFPREGFTPQWSRRVAVGVR
ncbi:hypothetical protein JTE90_009305 [Oedothorax gibbosus]|uniref:Uncharacterized protein n=1 Tax=Oedothorax gibbosus TaxID=931172 RepID=A0AAV6TDB8_9ARAC|nr:hypothetical protein JTE90_009305 [Oedothorax gibbosus]